MANAAPAFRSGASLPMVRTMSFISVPRPGPISAIVTGKGSAAGLPGVDQPDRYQFAEHLADFRRGNEVAFRAERLARRVVAVMRVEQAERHVVGDRDRAGGLDLPRYLLRQAVHAMRGSACERARHIAQTPASSIGVDRTMPMVSQPPNR